MDNGYICCYFPFNCHYPESLFIAFLLRMTQERRQRHALHGPDAVVRHNYFKIFLYHARFRKDMK